MTSIMIVFSFVVGLLLGGFYFGGLWLTIRRLPNNEMAGLWLLASFVSRTAVVLIGFFLVSDGQWARIIGCLAGFLIARTMIVRGSYGKMTPPQRPERFKNPISTIEQRGQEAR